MTKIELLVSFTIEADDARDAEKTLDQMLYQYETDDRLISYNVIDSLGEVFPV